MNNKLTFVIKPIVLVLSLIFRLNVVLKVTTYNHQNNILIRK